MRPDSIIKSDGFNTIFDKLDIVEAERFITLIKRDKFDYTKWRKNLWEDLSIDELSKRAMTYCKKKDKSVNKLG